MEKHSRYASDFRRLGLGAAPSTPEQVKELLLRLDRTHAFDGSPQIKIDLRILVAMAYIEENCLSTSVAEAIEKTRTRISP